MPDKSLVAKLRGTSAVTALVGTRIRCGLLDDADANKAIAVHRDLKRPVNHSTGKDTTRFADCSVYCCAMDYADAVRIADAVEAALNGYTNSGGTPAISMVHVRETRYEPGPVVPGRDKQREQFILDCLVQYRET